MKHILSALLVSLFLALVPTALASTTWYVNGSNGSDSNDCMSSQTACSTIGHAISLAASGDFIMVAATIYVENLTIGISLNVIGSGASTTIIDGASRGTVVTISSSGAQVTLARLTIRNGSGAGINNRGVLTLNDSTISNNSSQFFGGGIRNWGLLVVNNSTVSSNGVRWYCSNLKGPCVASGGGIYSSGTLTISNSTIGSNSVHLVCFLATTCQAFGGGVSGGGTLTINNSTLSGNWVQAQGPKAATLGSNISGSATLQNSILANGPNGENCAGIMTSKGYNLSSDNTCNFNGPGDLNNTDPKLDTLGYYGGPTQTIPLLSGSPAIDAGNPSGCTDAQGNLLKTDQRGMPRPDPQDTGGCDMGAYENQSD